MLECYFGSQNFWKTGSEIMLPYLHPQGSIGPAGLTLKMGFPMRSSSPTQPFLLSLTLDPSGSRTWSLSWTWTLFLAPTLPLWGHCPESWCAGWTWVWRACPTQATEVPVQVSVVQPLQRTSPAACSPRPPSQRLELRSIFCPLYVAFSRRENYVKCLHIVSAM